MEGWNLKPEIFHSDPIQSINGSVDFGQLDLLISAILDEKLHFWAPRGHLKGPRACQYDLGKPQHKNIAVHLGIALFFWGGGSPRVIKNQTPFLEKYFFSELLESFLDLQNMFYTWSGVHMFYLQPLGQL